jgi:hypothetical protein
MATNADRRMPTGETVVECAGNSLVSVFGGIATALTQIGTSVLCGLGAVIYVPVIPLDNLTKGASEPKPTIAQATASYCHYVVVEYPSTLRGMTWKAMKRVPQACRGIPGS